MKSETLLAYMCVFFWNNVRQISSQGLMQDMLSFAEFNTQDNVGPGQGSNSANFPALDPVEPPFQTDTGHFPDAGPPLSNLPLNTGSLSKDIGLPIDTSLSNEHISKSTNQSEPPDFGSITGNLQSNHFPEVPMDPVSAGDPLMLNPSANDPFANDPFANDPFANAPIVNDPFGMDSTKTGGDVLSVHQESPLSQFIPTSFKQDNKDSAFPIQTDPGKNQVLPSDSFTSSVKQVEGVSGSPLDPLNSVKSGTPKEPIQLGAGTSDLPTEKNQGGQMTPDQGTQGGDVFASTNESPLFRFLPNMPTGDKFLNLNDGTENTFQPTDNWMGEPLGIAKLEPNALDPWDSFLPEAPVTDINLHPSSANNHFQSDHQMLVAQDMTPVDLNPLGSNELTISGQEPKVADPKSKRMHSNNMNIVPIGHVDQGKIQKGTTDHAEMSPVDQNSITLGSVDNNALPLGPVDHNFIPLGTVDKNATPLGPIDHNALPQRPVEHNAILIGPIDHNAIPLGPVNTNPLPHKPEDKNPFKQADQNFIPFESVDTVLHKPKIDPGVIPLGPIFGTPVILDQVPINANQGQGYDGRRWSQPSTQIAREPKQGTQKIPSRWMQLYTKDRRRPNKVIPVQPEVSESVQVSPTDNMLAQASLNTYSKNRELTRRLRQERKRARKLRRLEKQKQKQLQKQQRHQQNQSNNARKQKQKRGNRRWGNESGPQGARVAKMVIPGQNQPFIGKNQRGRGRRMVEPCTDERRRLGLCAQDQLPSPALDPTVHSTLDNQGDVMVGVSDPVGQLSNIDGPNTYIGRQPVVSGANQLIDNMHGGIIADHLSTGNGRIEEHVGIPLGEALVGQNENGIQQLIGIQTIDPQNIHPERKLGRGGRRQQGNKFNRNGRQGNKGGRINNRNKNNNVTGRINNLKKEKRRNKRKRPVARTRDPIMRVPVMKDVGLGTLPIDNQTDTQLISDRLVPVTGSKVEHDPLHGTGVNNDVHNIFNPLGSNIQISPDFLNPMKSEQGQLTNMIHDAAAFHHQAPTVHLDHDRPGIRQSTDVLSTPVDMHGSVQHEIMADMPHGMSDKRRLNKKLRKQGRKNKRGGKQKIVSPLNDSVLPSNDTPLFDPQMTIKGRKNQRKKNKQKINKKGRKNWKKGNKQNKNKGPKVKEPRKFQPVEVQSVVKQEMKPTTPDTSGMMRIAGLGFIDLSG